MKNVLIGVITAYQKTLSPFLLNRCRFYPSCSSYAKEAIYKKGVLRGGAMGFLRLLRCHPRHPGGWDPIEKSDCNLEERKG